MSTSYYALRPPFSRLSVTTADGAHTVHVEIDGSPAGEFRCSDGWLPSVLSAFADSDRIAHRSNGVATMAHHLPDVMQVVSEYGDLTTIGHLRRGVAP